MKYSDVFKHGSYDALVEHMIDKEVFLLFHGTAEEIAEYFTTRLHLPWPEYDAHPALVVASRLRNCIIHNGAHVDEKLAGVTGWAAGTRIELSPEDVHMFGLDARDFAGQVWRAAVARHLGDEESSDKQRDLNEQKPI